MKKQNKGFTIVELVIVIAVIAVLAAVLIPTFSSLIKKANLSADMQAVREMNSCLQREAAAGNKPTSVEEAMKILSDNKFDSDHWVCLTKGYKIFWYQEKNVMVLYSPAGEGDIVYPEEYKKSWKNDRGITVNYFTAQTDPSGKKITLLAFNAHVENALNMDVDLASASTIKDNGSGSSVTELLNNSDASASEKAALENSQAAIAGSAELKNSLGFENSNVYVYASKEETSSDGNTYAAMQILQVGDTADPTLSNANVSGSQANLYYISICAAENATSAEIESAQKAASTYVYNLFVQINNSKIDDDVNIVLQPGITIDASGREWSPVKALTGYFGTTDASKPIVFRGGQLSNLTSYAETLYFKGSGGTYLVTGFLGSVYGETTIENIVFEEITVKNPAQDFDMSLTQQQHSRNTVGLIGAVVDESPIAPYTSASARKASNVTIRNVVVKGSVSIEGSASAAGLVGYVGGAGDKNRLYNGTLTMDNCHVSAKVSGGYEYDDYGPCGGLIAFACRTQEDSNTKDGASSNSENYNIVIKDCTFDGSVDGYTDIGAAIGNLVNGNVVFKGVNDFSDAKINVDGHSSDKRFIGSLIGKLPVVCYLSFEYADADHIKVGTNSTYPYMNIGGVKKVNDTPAAVNASGFYDASKSACQGEMKILANVRPSASTTMYSTVKVGETNVGTNDGTY